MNLLSRFGLVGLGLAMLAGCSGSLLPRPPPAPVRHTLDASTVEVAAPGPIVARTPPGNAPTVLVAPPRAAPGYDSVRLVYLRRPQALEAFAFHEWSAPPAQLLAPLIVAALQRTGAFRAVLLAPSTGSGRWRLDTELIRLQHDFTTQPSRVRLTLQAVLLDTSNRQVIAWREFDTSVPAAGDDPAGGVAAAREAAQEVLAALAAFCAAQAATAVTAVTAP